MKKKDASRSWPRRLLRLAAKAVLWTVLLAIGLNIMVIVNTHHCITAPEEVTPAECILVLGSGLAPDGTPGEMLTRRLDTALSLYDAGAAPVLLMSGDHSRAAYDEPGAMRQYALDHGVPDTAIRMDPQGLCTWDSMVRARQVYRFNTAIIVSQDYHLARSVWDAEHQGLTVQAVAAPMYDWGWDFTLRLYGREFLARLKDLGVSLLHMGFWDPDTDPIGPGPGLGSTVNEVLRNTDPSVLQQLRQISDGAGMPSGQSGRERESSLPPEVQQAPDDPVTSVKDLLHSTGPALLLQVQQINDRMTQQR